MNTSELNQDPQAVNLQKIKLSNSQMYVEIITVGASIYGIYLPEGGEKYTNIVLNYPEPENYLTDNYYMGATVGRVAGRISEGMLPVNGKIHQLHKNENGRHHLHGGYEGFNKKNFDVVEIENKTDRSSVKLHTSSEDGEEGYPGKLNLTVTYTLYENNTLRINYEASTDSPTHINLTNHSYFNLSGERTALNQILKINANEILETNDLYIPTGKKISVKETPYDFTSPTLISNQKKQLGKPCFNECYVLQKKQAFDAVLIDKMSNRKMELKTSYPAILFYSGDYLAAPYKPNSGICLEAQFFPDAANHNGNTQTLLVPNETYNHEIQLSFSW